MQNDDPAFFKPHLVLPADNYVEPASTWKKDAQKQMNENLDRLSEQAKEELLAGLEGHTCMQRLARIKEHNRTMETWGRVAGMEYLNELNAERARRLARHWEHSMGMNATNFPGDLQESNAHHWAELKPLAELAEQAKQMLPDPSVPLDPESERQLRARVDAEVRRLKQDAEQVREAKLADINLRKAQRMEEHDHDVEAFQRQADERLQSKLKLHRAVLRDRKESAKGTAHTADPQSEESLKAQVASELASMVNDEHRVLDADLTKLDNERARCRTDHEQKLRDIQSFADNLLVAERRQEIARRRYSQEHEHTTNVLEAYSDTSAMSDADLQAHLKAQIDKKLEQFLADARATLLSSVKGLAPEVSIGRFVEYARIVKEMKRVAEQELPLVLSVERERRRVGGWKVPKNGEEKADATGSDTGLDVEMLKLFEELLRIQQAGPTTSGAEAPAGHPLQKTKGDEQQQNSNARVSGAAWGIF